MRVTGKIVNGSVVLPPGTKLPEGAEVKIETIATDDPFLAAVERLAKPLRRGLVRNIPTSLTSSIYRSFRETILKSPPFSRAICFIRARAFSSTVTMLPTRLAAWVGWAITKNSTSAMPARPRIFFRSTVIKPRLLR